MSFLTVNKRNNISLQLAFTLLFLVSALLLVAHARDISSSSSRRVDGVVKLQDAEPVESSDISGSRSSHAFETMHEQENLSGTEGTDDDLLVVDYTPVRKKSPIHN